jgi:crotonobetainyl-CoA:carnitine CoA-transferase CaiB-like acyl-CoA transferase
MDGARFGTRLDIPRVGEHTREVLEQLGYSAAEIEKLAADKAVLVR